MKSRTLVSTTDDAEVGIDIAAGRSSIPFPYKPYPQQRDLMHSIFDTIAHSRSGCFESPTGTGKSLSILCAALHWQRLQEEAILLKCENELAEAEKKEKENRTVGGKAGLGSSAKSSNCSIGSGDWLADLLASDTASVGAGAGAGAGTAKGTDRTSASQKQKTMRKAMKRLNKMNNRIAKAAAIEPDDKAALEDFLGTRIIRRRSTNPFELGGGGKGKTLATADRNSDSAGRGIEDGGLLPDEAEFVLDAYDSADEADSTPGTGAGTGKGKGKAGNDVDALLNDPFGLGKEFASGSDSDSSSDSTSARERSTHASSSSGEKNKNGGGSFRETLRLPQIIYCSRTHSQIAQFVSEMRKTAYGQGLRCVTLGSRKNMCINAEVLRLGGDSRINDRCLEMAKSGSSSVSSSASASAPVSSSSSSAAAAAAAGAAGKRQRVAKLASCKFKNKKLEDAFADFALGKVRDIEELVSLGRTLEACPYYSTRKAVQLAQVICAPYSVLLHAETRESMGINLKGAVVIFDEAHNVVEAVNHIHSADVSVDQLCTAQKAISAYSTRFQLALSGKNLFYVTLMATLVRKLLACVKDHDKKAAVAAAAAGASSGVAAASAASDTAARSDDPSSAVKMLSCNDFLFESRLDGVNLLKLRRHVVTTNLIGKIGGFAESVDKRAAAAAAAAAVATTAVATGRAQGGAIAPAVLGGCATCPSAAAADPLLGNPNQEATASTYALRAVLSLITCLAHSDADGRVVLTSVPGANSTEASGSATTQTHPHLPAASGAATFTNIRFVLLNAAVYFRQLADEARSVLLLGGTLQPFGYVTSSLFDGCVKPIQDLQLFACGHVVDSANVQALALESGPNGIPLEFTHKTRNATSLTDELFRTLLQTARICPHGMVVFFTSYAYMDQLMSRWAAQGHTPSLRACKRVFVEPRTVAESEGVWEQYSACIAASTLAAAAAAKAGSGSGIGTGGGGGAILFCVMGGKLSEGINFSDDLARCVVVVGMPYPDGRDPILQEKMKRADMYAQQQAQAQANGAAAAAAASASASASAGNRPTTATGSGTAAGRLLYEAMCMKSVNQSIGRSIRHAGDYAAILLLDRRYTQESVVRQLPGWIAQCVSRPHGFSSALDTLSVFFSKKRQQQQQQRQKGE